MFIKITTDTEREHILKNFSKRIEKMRENISLKSPEMNRYNLGTTETNVSLTLTKKLTQILKMLQVYNLLITEISDRFIKNFF